MPGETARPLNAHDRRVRLMILVTSWPTIVIGLGWGVFFAFVGDWTVVISDALVTAAGVLALRLLYKNQLRNAAVLLVASLAIRVVAMAVFLDVPNDAAPRSLQNYLIPLGLASYLMLKHENPWLRNGLSWGCLTFAVVLASHDWVWTTRYAVPDSIRVPGTWSNNLTAMGLLLGLLILFVTDIDRIEHGMARLKGWLGLGLKRAAPALWEDSARGWRMAMRQERKQVVRVDEAGTRHWHSLQERRYRLLALLSSGLLMAMGCAFGLMSLAMNVPVMALSDLLIAMFGFAWARGYNTEGHSGMVVPVTLGLVVVLAFQAITFDIPRPAFPRTAHYMLLPVSLAAYFLLRHEAPRVQFCIPGLALLAFVFLGSSDFGVWMPFTLPDTLRPPSWLLCLSALGVLYLFVHVLVGDIVLLEAWAERTLSWLSAIMARSS